MGWPWSKKKPDVQPKSQGERVRDAIAEALKEAHRQQEITQGLLDELNAPKKLTPPEEK